LSCIIGLIVGGALNTHVELELEPNKLYGNCTKYKLQRHYD